MASRSPPKPPRSSEAANMRAILLIASLATACALLACGSKQETNSASSATVAALATPGVPTPSPAALPDVGKLEQVSVTTQGSGPTAAAAVQEAMKLAILEVNGATIDTGSVAVKFGLDVGDGQTEATIRGATFAEAVTQHSKGVISRFKVDALTDPVDKEGLFKAVITASIAKFQAPDDGKKIRIVVAPLHVNTASFEIGGQYVSAAKVAADIRRQIIDALTATGRFSVLDRDFGAEAQQELELVDSGQTPSNEMAKLSQTLSADILWVGTINDFSYVRSAHKLQTSDRELVSYSGGWSVSQRLLNVATRQILLSNTIQEQEPATDPTTLDRGISIATTEANMQAAVMRKAIAAILTHTFPVTVVAKDGVNVVRSQGGLSVKEGARYAAVILGKEITDPQTQQSLGHVESACCDVVVDRVTTNLAYAHIENPNLPIESVDATALQLREELRSVRSPQRGSTEQPAKMTNAEVEQASTAAAHAAAASPQQDTKKW
jgi:curli biogenesis system outer membrane secretion channel CsgG